MGYLIVTIVGAILGWLTIIVMSQDNAGGTVPSAVAGVIGGLAMALAIGEVPLSQGLSATQLLWSVVGALLSIAAYHVIKARRASI